MRSHRDSGRKPKSVRRLLCILIAGAVLSGSLLSVLYLSAFSYQVPDFVSVPRFSQNVSSPSKGNGSSPSQERMLIEHRYSRENTSNAAIHAVLPGNWKNYLGSLVSFLRTRNPKASIDDMLRVTPFDLRITIMTHRRFENAIRILEAVTKELSQANRFADDAVHVSILLIVDFDNKTSEFDRRQLRRNVKALSPEIMIEFSQVYKGKKKSWLDLWKPTNMDSFNLVIEDDVEISSKTIKSSVLLIRSVYYKTTNGFEDVLGISLCNENDRNCAFTMREEISELLKRSDTFRQAVCTSGIVLAASGWREFLLWNRNRGKNYDPVLKDALSNRWPIEHSWRKLVLRYLAESNMFMYYPLFPRGETLIRKLTLKERAFTKLNGGNHHLLVNVSFAMKNAALAAPRLDYKLEPVSSDYSSFDGCTFILPVCHRLATIPELIAHYSSVPFKAQIILVQQPCGGTHRPINLSRKIKNVPIVILKMPANDMNNRYKNFNEILYDCVINVDDDVMHPHQSMHTLVKLWKASFFDYYVGWYQQARIHVTNETAYLYKNRTWVDNIGGYASLLLPSGSVFHRKFLIAYNSEENRPAREFVSKVLNCEDILMNFVISNSTRKGPLFVDDWNSMNRSAEMLAMSNDIEIAQWKKPDHLSKRTNCVNAFVKMYGRMPLRYSTVLLSYDTSREQIPVRVPRKVNVRHMSPTFIPSRHVTRHVADLCDEAGLSFSERNITCRRTFKF
jgi:Glycosyl transferase family 64 domain